ncbi:MAG: hypothetical protein WA021_02230 [Minisyncoccia bacterium]
MDDNLKNRVEELENRVKALEASLVESVRTATVIHPDNRVNFLEFLGQKKLDDDVKRTLAIAYWLDYFEKVDSFNVSDIEKYFRLARYSVPKNLNDKLSMNEKNKHIHPLRVKKDGKKAWYITNRGADFVETKLQNNKQK